MPETWFTIHRASLLPALSRVSDAVDTRSKIPILSHVLLQGDGATLRLRCTNLDLQIEAECEMMEDADFPAVALPVSRLSAILKELPESAEIAIGPGRLNDQVGVRAGRSSFSLPSLPGSDFPEMGRAEVGAAWAEIDGAKLSDALKKVSYAINKLDDRRYLCGLCLHAGRDGGGIVVAATDGHYLAQVRLPDVGTVRFPDVENSYPHVILPPMGAEPIRKLLDGAKRARIAVSREKISVAYDGVEIKTKLIDGTYPLYERVIPPRTEQTIVLAKEAFASGVRRVAAMVDDAKNDGIRLRVEREGLRIDMLTGEGGFACDLVQGEIKAPEGFTVAHSAPRLEKTLAGIHAVDIELSLTDEATAVVMRPLDGSPELYLLSAMRPRFVAE